MSNMRARAALHLSLGGQDIDKPHLSSPYKRVPKSCEPQLDETTLTSSPQARGQSPSSSTDNLRDEMVGAQRDMDAGVKRPIVHYPSNLSAPLSAQRLSSDDGPSNKAPSLSGTDDDDNEEGYDWSTDSDLVDEEAKFEQKMGGEISQKGWGPKRVATFFLSTLLGSTLLAGVIIAVPLLLHFYYYLPHRSDHRKYITDNVSAWLYWAAANLLLSWYLAMIVDVTPIICINVIELAWGEVHEDVRSRIELYNAAKDKFKPVLYGASGWTSWIVIFDGIYGLHNRRNESLSRVHYTTRTYQAIQFLFYFTLVLSVEKILSHMIAFAFHRKAFIERMETLKFNLKVIDHLRDYRPRRQSNRQSAHRPVFSFPGLGTYTSGQEKPGANSGGNSAKRRTAKPDVFSDDDGHTGDTEEVVGQGSHHSKKGKERKSWAFPTMLSRQNTAMDGFLGAAPTDQPYQQREAHAYPPVSPPQVQAKIPRTIPQLGKSGEEEPAMVFQAAKALKTAVLHDARNMKGKEDGSASLGWRINSAHEAKRVARSIYTAFKVDRHRNYLIPSDFYPAYANQEDAEVAFKVFDEDNNGDISRAEIKTMVLKVYKERRALNRSLRDVGNALETLDWIMIFFAMVILFFISLSVFHIAIGSSLTSFYTIGIAASFIFKNTASSAFDAVMFIFVTHPFDTGDRCFIDGSLSNWYTGSMLNGPLPDENLVVKQMGLFATIFSRADGTETYYFNSQLFTKFITNVQRSGKMFENITLQVAWRTPLEKLDQLEKRMNGWLATEENRWFEPTTAVTLQKIEYQRCLEFTMSIGHNGTWQDWGLRNARKTAFLTAVHFYCRQLGIFFHNSPQPVILVENEEQLTNIGMRLPTGSESFPTSPISPGSGGQIISGTDLGIAGNERDKDFVLLGFKPPPDARSTLTRARKSRLRKGNLRGMGEGGGDGG